MIDWLRYRDVIAIANMVSLSVISPENCDEPFVPCPERMPACFRRRRDAHIIDGVCRRLGVTHRVIASRRPHYCFSRLLTESACPPPLARTYVFIAVCIWVGNLIRLKIDLPIHGTSAAPLSRESAEHNKNITPIRLNLIPFSSNLLRIYLPLRLIHDTYAHHQFKLGSPPSIGTAPLPLGEPYHPIPATHVIPVRLLPCDRLVNPCHQTQQHNDIAISLDLTTQSA